VYIPHRELEGYGLNIMAIKKFIGAGAKLLITLDCGTTNINEIDLANEHGLDTIVVDHHHAPSELPKCIALINAKVEGDRYPFEHLAGVGVTFKLAQALLADKIKIAPEQSNELKKFEKWLLDLVAIATVTDLVPLSGENRTYLKFGLMVLNRTRRPGLKALIQKIGSPAEVTADTIAFQIGPRLNAPGRMAHANLAFRLLSTDDDEEAEKLADELESLNRKRQTVTEKMAVEAEASLLDKDSSIAVAVGKGWPAGLVGLVASRITEKLHKPSLVITIGENGVMGSGRSIPDFNIIEAMHLVSEGVFVKFGGHAQACGFTLVNEEAAKALQASLHNQITNSLNLADLLPTIEIESDLLLSEVNWSLVKNLQLLEPFGMENKRPIFLLSRIHLGAVSSVGASNKHLRVTLTDAQGNVKHGIGFGLAHKLEEVMMGDMIDVVAEISVNQWNGKKDLQLRIFDIRKSI
jgi:single-stranded-DNA-specific exonuclease